MVLASLPMILVNGAEGIGTGWSTNIPSYNPKDLVTNIRRLMNGEELQEMTPWYKDGVVTLNQWDRKSLKFLDESNKLI